MPRKVADLVKEIPLLQEKLGIAILSAKELREMGAKELRGFEKKLLKEIEEAPLVPPAVPRRRKLKKSGAAPVVSSEEAKVLEQTESAFLPAAIAESTKKLVTGAKAAPSTLKAAEDAVEGVGIKVIKKAKAPRKPSAKVDVAKIVREVESETKLLEAEKKGLLKDKGAKQKARDIRFAKAGTEETAEMQVKEGASKAKALLGKVKEKVVEKVAERKKRVRKVAEQKAMAAVPHAEKKPRKTPLRTHKIPVESVVAPALGHPSTPKVPKYSAGVDRELSRVGISV